jgi:hypothetical protein
MQTGRGDRAFYVAANEKKIAYSKEQLRHLDATVSIFTYVLCTSPLFVCTYLVDSFFGESRYDHSNGTSASPARMVRRPR